MVVMVSGILMVKKIDRVKTEKLKKMTKAVSSDAMVKNN